MNEGLPIVYLARHGETAWSLSRQHTGLTDLPLTERGQLNARNLGERLQGMKFAAVFTSPLKRAARTCELAGFGLVPIVEPEVDIHCPQKRQAEALLKAAILEGLNKLPAGQLVMLKLTLPDEDDFYVNFVQHPSVLRVVALSGGYRQQEANDRLRRNHGIAASFSRALVEGLSAQQSDAEFNSRLDRSIQSIFEASNT